MQSLPRNKTNILKNLILAIYYDHYNLNYTLNVFLFDYLAKELKNKSESNVKGTSTKGVVIDVTEE
jgi:hypothetical protein